MPICKREGFEDFTKNPKQQTFHDNEEVFYCETTKQIFRDYEEYFRHVMVINSTIWQCEETGRENLTYAEALKSERRARMKMDQFKDCLRPIVMLLIEKIQQSSMKALCHLSYSFIRSRFFVEEDVEAVNKSTTHLKYVVVGVVPLSSAKTPPDGNVYDPTKVTYKLRKVGGQFHGKEYLIPRGSIRRGRNECCHDNLRLFIKNNVTRVEGILRPNPESYKKYVTDRKITFAKVFLGKLPHYEPSKPIKPKKLDSEKKQASMAKYLTKDGVEKARKGETPEEEAARQQRSKALLEEMERVRKEKEAKQAELERKKMERLAKIETEAAALAKKTDDLERFDQQPLPKFKSISTQIPNKYFGDCIMIQEFMHSFVGILSGIHVFRNNISFFELTRAFTTREVAGPLSDIIMILLGTIFDLQQEEESECNVEYQRLKNKEREPYATIALATKTHEFTKRFYGYKINELPLDAQTVSEILRLHLLGSGANVSGKTERWRIMYRNGYYSSEDPGLALRMSQPHILRALKMYTVYQLPIVEIFHIINTLIAQILTYSSTINMIEERMEQTAKSKMELRTLVAAENRRMCNVESERKKLILEHAIQIKELPEENKVMEEKLNKKVADLLAISARERKKFDAQIEKVRSSLFDYMVFLGMDRAYRKYYVLESMPGIFVEHSSECHDVCLENPPKNVPHLVGCPRTLREIRMHLSRLYVEEEDPSRKKRKAQPAQPQAQANQENKENKENQAVMNGGVKLNGDANKMEADGAVEPETIVPEVPPPPPTQYQLMMCTGDPNNCIVHDHKNPDRQRWAFFHTEEDLDALIKSLNSLGDRESALKEQLKTMRELIASHIKKCPVEMLSIEDENTSRFSRFKAQMRDETRRKYNAANFGFPDNTDLSEVMYAMLVDRILQMEIDTTTGDLGKLKIKDLEKWRSDVQNNTYDSQAELKWGIGNEAKPHKDPGLSLGDTIDIDSEDSSDEGISLHDSPILRQCVKNLSSALLQIEQGIEQRFLKEPFGVNKEIKDKDKMDGFLERGRYRLRHWETSLMKSTSYSQVFLHLNILHGAIKWQRSTNKSSCQICRRMTDPEKMLLCDECNAGTHMFCMKPKMKTVPEGNWYCKRCVTKLGITDANKEPIKNKRKRAFLLDEEDNGSEGSSRSINRRQRKHLRIEEIEEQIEEEEEQQSEEDVDESLEGEDSDGDDKDPEYEATEEDKREAAADCSGEDVEAEDEGEQAVDDDDDDDDDEDDEDDDEEEEVEEEEEEVEDKVETPRDPLANSKDEEEVEDEQEEQDSSIDEDEEACVVCSYNGGEIACAGCKSVYHLDCVDLKRPPRSNWNCRTCKGAQSKKRKSKQNEDSTDDEEYDQPLVKRPRNSTGNKRSSARSAMYEGHSSEEFIRTNNNNSRRARRAGDHLPLNSSILYDLLDDIMKNDSSWPFLRPVSASEVPDYHKIIKEPMDFAKVKSKLNMGKYTINEELLKDIELIFKNCDIYNQEGNEIYEAGSSLEKFVMARCKELQLPFQPSDMNRS